MKRKFNLTLVPQSKSNEVTQLAHKLSDIADGYILGEKSLPHVTLYQFEAKEEDIEDIWEHVCEAWEEKPIDLEFNKFSCLTFNDAVFWVSLLPNNGNGLRKMHCMIAGILGFPLKASFDPHMTLINSKNKAYKEVVDKLSSSYSPIADTFTLALGKSDDLGQLTEIVHYYEIARRN